MEAGYSEQHTGLDPETVTLIIKGLKEIDTERAGILSKVISKWKLPFVIPFDLEVPKDMQEQLRVNLPLLDRQIYRLDMMIRKYYKDKYPSKQNSKSMQPTVSKVSLINEKANMPDLSKFICSILKKAHFLSNKRRGSKAALLFYKAKA
jgi:hypothetical protein